MGVTRIAVIGAGLMGHGIALTFARSGHPVAVSDPSPEARGSLLDRVFESLDLVGAPIKSDEVLGQITVHETLANAVSGAQFVIEAAPERLEIKRGIFAEVEPLVSPDCIFASNTSVIPIKAIFGETSHRERALGTHWWNPPHLIPLVEVIRTKWTSDTVLDATTALLEAVGKSTVRVERDVPGFIGNRLQHALWREAISLVERGVCDAEAVDTVVKSCFGRRLSVLGPLENADLVGTDLTLDIHNTVLADLENRRGPSPYLEQLVADGRLGMKAGQGFRTWTLEEVDRVRTKMNAHLLRLEQILND